MLKKHRNKIIISSLVILGIILILFGSLSLENQGKENENYINSLEKKLESFLVGIDGINEADVIIMLEEAESEHATGVFATENNTINYPKVSGVAVACTNGNDYKTKQQITNVVSSYLGVPTNRIKIVAIK